MFAPVSERLASFYSALFRFQRGRRAILSLLPFAASFWPGAVLADAPHDIVSGQVLWLDGADIYGTDTGNGGGIGPGDGAVTMWKDKSPSGFVAGEASSYGATTHAYPTGAYIKSTTGVSFNGSSQVLEIPGGIFSGTVSASEFFIGASTVIGQKGKSQYLFWHGPTTGGTSRISAAMPMPAGMFTDSRYWDHGGATATTGRLTGSWNWNDAAGVSYVYNMYSSVTNGDQQLLADGSSLMTGSYPTAYVRQAGDTFYIGAGYPGSNTFHGGSVSDLIVYSRRLNGAERKLINNYLIAKVFGQEQRGMPYQSLNGYIFHLGGIGREADGRVSVGTSAGLTITDVSFLNVESRRYFIAGVGAMSTGTVTGFDVSTGWQAVSSRRWEIQSSYIQSSTLGNVTLTFDLDKMGVSAAAGTKLGLGYRSAPNTPYYSQVSAIYDGSGKVSFTFPVSINGFIALMIGAGPSISSSLTSSPVSDPVNSTNNPKLLPGALVRFTMPVTNNGTGSPDANSTVLTFAVPSSMKFYLGDIGTAGGGPMAFAQGAVSSGLSYAWSSLSSTTDGLDFSRDSGASWTYVPTADAQQGDTLITNVRVRLNGTFASGTSPNFPSFSVNYGMLVK